MKILRRNVVAHSLLVACVGSALLFSASAQSEWDNAGIGNVKILRIVVLQDGDFYLMVDKNVCKGGQPKIARVFLNKTVNGKPWTQMGADMMLRTSTAAYLSGKAITVYANDPNAEWGCLMGALSID